MMKKNKPEQSGFNEILLYNTPNGGVKATCKEYLQVQKEGNRKVKRKQLFYNLDAILTVGKYKRNSKLNQE